MDETNVTPIKKTRKKTAHLITNPKDWTVIKIQNDILEHVDQLAKEGKLQERYPEYFANFRQMRLHDQDIETILEIKPNKEVRRVTKADFNHHMLGFYRQLFDERYLGEKIGLTTQTITSETIIKYLTKIDPKDIKIFSWKSQDLYAWQKMDFDPIPSETLHANREKWVLDNDEALLARGSEEYFMRELETYSEVWYSILKRCSNRLAVLAWFGQVFTPGCKNQQFLYMQGDGGDSKGALSNAVQMMLPKTYLNRNLPEARSAAIRWLAGDLEGKRLYVIPDMDPTNIFTPFLKSLTGGDELAAEKKGKDVRNAENHVCTLMQSNFPPRIPKHPYAKRRIIYTFVQAHTGDIDPNFKQKLFDDRKMFVSIAMAAYESMGPTGRISQDESVYELNDALEYEDVDAFIADYFILSIEDNMAAFNGEKMTSIALKCPVSHFNEYCRQHFPSRNPLIIKERISTKMGFNMLPKFMNDAYERTTRCYVGIATVQHFLDGATRMRENRKTLSQ